MPYLSPPTLTREEQRSLLEASASHPRDHLIFSVALGTGLRLGEIVGLNVGDMFFPDGRPKSRIRLRADIAKYGRAADVFLPSALMRKLEAFWAYKVARRERLDPAAPLFCDTGWSVRTEDRKFSKFQCDADGWFVESGHYGEVLLRTLAISASIGDNGSQPRTNRQGLHAITLMSPITVAGVGRTMKD
jgi:Phage integrase family